MNLLQRLPQGAKVALAAALLVAAVAVWYIGFFRPSQAAQAPATPAPAPSAPPATARPLEVLPVPFLVTEAPRPEPLQEQGQGAAAVATTRPPVTVPPNPFIPLVSETAPAALAQPSPPPSSRPATPPPIPSQQTQIKVQQPATPLPRPSLPGTRPTAGAAAPSPPSAQARLAQGTARANLPPTVDPGSGVLPIRLAPLQRELSSAGPSTPTAALDVPSTSGPTGSDLGFARAEIDARLVQVLEPKSSPARPQETTQESSLARFVREQNLKLTGVVLGPTSVAIFQSKDGFTVLPVGRTLPGSDVLLKSLSAKEALLVQGSETLNLTMDNP